MPIGERPSPEHASQHLFPIEHREIEPVSNVAISFPGQDINKPGLFDDIVKHPSGREVMIRANSILSSEFGFRISRTVDTEPDGPMFSMTQFIQPRVYVASIATHNVNKHEHGKEGYKTLPRYLTGNSMGIVTAATLAGSISFEDGLRLIAKRGEIMQKFTEPTATKMVMTLNGNEEIVRDLLSTYQDLDMCLVNSDSGFVYGGPSDSVDAMTASLREQKVKTLPVNADRAMHSRYTRAARKPFEEYLKDVKFKTPMVPIVGTLTGRPIRTPDEIREEIAHGIDNTFDNRKILTFFDEAGVELFSEINEKGIFAKALERTMGAIASHKAEAGAILSTSAMLGYGIYEVLTRHNPKNGNSD